MQVVKETAVDAVVVVAVDALVAVAVGVVVVAEDEVELEIEWVFELYYHHRQTKVHISKSSVYKMVMPLLG